MLLFRYRHYNFLYSIATIFLNFLNFKKAISLVGYKSLTVFRFLKAILLRLNRLVYSLAGRESIFFNAPGTRLERIFARDEYLKIYTNFPLPILSLGQDFFITINFFTSFCDNFFRQHTQVSIVNNFSKI